MPVASGWIFLVFFFGCLFFFGCFVFFGFLVFFLCFLLLSRFFWFLLVCFLGFSSAGSIFLPLYPCPTSTYDYKYFPSHSWTLRPYLALTLVRHVLERITSVALKFLVVLRLVEEKRNPWKADSIIQRSTYSTLLKYILMG